MLIDKDRARAVEELEWFCATKALEDQNHPSAERVGHWIERHPMRHDGKFLGCAENDIEDTRFSLLYCSECGTQMPIFEYFPYCPYCKAKMELKDWMKELLPNSGAKMEGENNG